MHVRHRVRGMFLSAAVLLVFLLVATPTLVAQPVSLADTPMEVQIWPGGQQGYTLFIVTGHLPEDAVLPASVRLPVPDGAEIIWAGEILGGPVADDPAREFLVVDGIDGRALEMTAEGVRTVQYEAIGPALTVVDGLITSEFEWIQSTHAAEVAFAVRVPASAGTVRISPEPPGPPVMNEGGDRLYALTPALLTEGMRYSITIGYGPEGAGGSDGGGLRLVGLLAVLLGVAVVLLVLALAAQRGRAHGASIKI